MRGSATIDFNGTTIFFELDITRDITHEEVLQLFCVGKYLYAVCACSEVVYKRVCGRAGRPVYNLTTYPKKVRDFRRLRQARNASRIKEHVRHVSKRAFCSAGHAFHPPGFSGNVQRVPLEEWPKLLAYLNPRISLAIEQPESNYATERTRDSRFALLRAALARAVCRSIGLGSRIVRHRSRGYRSTFPVLEPGRTSHGRGIRAAAR